MANRAPFAENEWYHCYTRTVDKSAAYKDTVDKERFIELLYLTNAERTLHRSDFVRLSTTEILDIQKGEELVEIGAFCLMPTHFHLLLKSRREGGLTSFMRKLLTGYTMYFNKRNQRIGNLFIVPFRARHISDDRYFQRVIQYIHCNPAELFEPHWKEGIVQDAERTVRDLKEYRYSSLGVYSGYGPYAKILSPVAREIWQQISPEEMVAEAIAYYSEARQGGTLMF